jgi:hypothetical protein
MGRKRRNGEVAMAYFMIQFEQSNGEIKEYHQPPDIPRFKTNKGVKLKFPLYKIIM